jgi:ATP-binding cassette, subfamily G (WHITE), member 2
VQWYAYIDFLRYAWGALMISQFRGKTYKNADGVESEIMIGNQPILKYYGLEKYTAWEMLGYEVIFFVVFFAAAWAALQFKRLSKR